MGKHREIADVAVIGGGIGGIVASLALQNAGFSTNVFESKPDFSELGVAVIISPNGLNALKSLGRGIADEVIEHGRPVPINGILRVLDKDGRSRDTGRPFGELDQLEPLYGSPQVVIRRNVFHTILLDAHGPGGLHADSEMLDYVDSGDAVAARFADGTTVQASVLVGADGLNSAARKQVNSPEGPRYTGWSNLRGVTRGMNLPAGLEDGLVVIVNHDHVMSCPVGREGDLYWSSAFEVEAGSWPRTPAEAHQEVLSRIEGWFWVEELVKNVDPATLNPREIRDRLPIDTYTRGRVALLGDAAHAMGNFWGQGANSAIEDGVVLARVLREAAGDVAGALSAYDAERVPRTSRLQIESARIDRHLGDHEAFTRWIYSYDAASGQSLIAGAPLG